MFGVIYLCILLFPYIFINNLKNYHCNLDNIYYRPENGYTCTDWINSSGHKVVCRKIKKHYSNSAIFECEYKNYIVCPYFLQPNIPTFLSNTK